RYAWWAPIVLAGTWLATHWLLRESAVWRDRNTEEVRGAQRDADYAYRLAVDPPASKELRLFGLAGWTIDRFIARRTRLHELQYAATRRSPRCCAGCTIRNPVRSRSTASTFASSIWRRGARASRPCSRTSSASSCRCATTWRRPARLTMWCAPRSSRQERRTWPHW